MLLKAAGLPMTAYVDQPPLAPFDVLDISGNAKSHKLLSRLNRIVLITAAFVVGITHRAALAEDAINVSRQIDRLVEQNCAAQGISSLGRCSDLEFLRRIGLDLTGRIPPSTVVTKVIADATLVREDVIEQFINSPDFAKHWGRMYGEYLTDRRPFDSNGYDGRALQQSLTESLRKHRPYDEVVRELIVSEGMSDINGAANFLLRYDADPALLAGAVGRKFLGVSLQCAECHDHPHARWKQDDFWGLAAHFARLRKVSPPNPENGEAFFVVLERPRGELTTIDRRAKPNEAGEVPRKTVFPKLPGLPRTASKLPRRTVLAEWLTNPENPLLSRHLVNLVWEWMIGEKLIPNLDQWPPQTTSLESELLNLLATDCAHHGWDVQRLVRIIALSETYQRSSHGDRSSPAALRSEQRERQLADWGRARIRPLSADQIHLSIGQAFRYHHDDNDRRLAESTGEDFAQDIPVNNLGPTSFSLVRSMALYNSEYIRGAIQTGVAATVRRFGPAAGVEQIEHFFVSLLGRLPTTEELEFFQDLAGQGNPEEGLQDVVWVILNSAEFVTNH